MVVTTVNKILQSTRPFVTEIVHSLPRNRSALQSCNSSVHLSTALFRNSRLFSSLRFEEPTHTYGKSNTAQSSASVIILPNTGLLRMPEYSCFIPEHRRPQRGTSRVFRNNCFIPERIFQRLGQL
jgi:hypothetical protein